MLSFLTKICLHEGAYGSRHTKMLAGGCRWRDNGCFLFFYFLYFPTYLHKLSKTNEKKDSGSNSSDSSTEHKNCIIAISTR